MTEPQHEMLPEGTVARVVIYPEDDIPMTDTEAARLERLARPTPTPNTEG